VEERGGGGGGVERFPPQKKDFVPWANLVPIGGEGEDLHRYSRGGLHSHYMEVRGGKKTNSSSRGGGKLRIRFLHKEDNLFG